jgi:hypothetical protein
LLGSHGFLRSYLCRIAFNATALLLDLRAAPPRPPPEIKQSSRLGSSCFFSNFFQNLRDSVAQGGDLGSVLARKVRILFSEKLSLPVIQVRFSCTAQRSSEIKAEDFAQFRCESAESAGRGGLDFLSVFGAWNNSFHFQE